MSVDKKRVRKFRLEMESIQKGLSFEDFYTIFKSKLLDQVAKNQIEGEYLKEYFNQVKKLFHPEFVKYIDRIYESYNRTLELVNAHYTDMGVDVSRDFQKIEAIERVNLARLGEYEQSTVREISRAIRKGVLGGDDYKKIAREIGKIDDKANHYADTLARTQVKGYSRAAKHEKANMANVQYYEYVGIIRPTTRPFCRTLVGKTRHLREIRLMKNGQLEPVITYCGGYNCHHDWEPNPFYDPGEADRKRVPIIFKAGQRETIIFGDPEDKKVFQSGINLEKFRTVNDIDKYIEKAKQAGVSESYINHVLTGHQDEFADPNELIRETERTRNNPDHVYYQFHNGKSTIIFERKGRFVFSTDRKLITTFRPTDKEEYHENVVKYWINLNEVKNG